MTTPIASVGGLVSGLDTNTIVAQLMAIERNPVVALEQRRAAYEAKNAAWDTIATRLTAVRDAVRAVDEAADWAELVTAASSNPGAVEATVSGAPTVGSTSFTVDRLAAAHQVASTGTFSSGTDLVGAGTFSVTVDGVQHVITTDATTTVSDLASRISALGVGLSASLLFVTSNEARLVVTASDTGAASEFTVDSVPFAGGTSVVTAGVDAQLTVGSGPGALTLTRASNTISDLVPGVTLSLGATSSSPVTVTTARDIDGAAGRVTGLVSALNSALDALATATKAAEDDAAAGPLAGDATARSLGLELRSAISGVVVDGRTASSIGISLTREGRFTVDEAKLRASIEESPAAVAALFARTVSATDPRVGVSLAGSSALDGTHAVAVTAAASRAGVTGPAYSPPAGDEVFTVTAGSSAANVTVAAGSDLAAAVAAVNTSLADAGITTVVAVDDGGALRIEETRYGSAFSFSVSPTGLGIAGDFAGTDAAGTIGGIAATGSGRSLTGTGGLAGLVLTVSATPAEVAAAGGVLDLGTVTVTSGVAARFDETLEGIVGAGGAVDRARDRWTSQITLVDDRIERMEDRLALREAALRAQFTALEQTMARLSALSTSLGASLAALTPPQ